MDQQWPVATGAPSLAAIAADANRDQLVWPISRTVARIHEYEQVATDAERIQQFQCLIIELKSIVTCSLSNAVVVHSLQTSKHVTNSQ